MLLVSLAVKTVLSISQNVISSITLNKQLGNHLNMDIINASSYVMLVTPVTPVTLITSTYRAFFSSHR
jgi:hypothetical protein